MRYLVVHAHLYQPPRENPWTEVIERQPSAAPFHDWNERVSDECYERLGAAGVHGPDGRIVALVNLFERISFNIGPTLASWLERERPDAMRDAALGDRRAKERTGFGSALMQPYGHPILPLCEPRERKLQLAWGRADFVRRFGRPPEGVWLPECAVDLPTLEACADAGLMFTVVAPEQALRVRSLSTTVWEDVSGSRVPPHRPYVVRLPSGRNFTVFVFDGPLSRGAAFGGKLRDGETLLAAFKGALDGIPGQDGAVILASDGETFGHHQRHAEETLAEALVRSRLNGLAQVGHLGEVFRRIRPTHELKLAEPSSWSCPHGVGRWERDCGCAAGARGAGWNWAWRQPLRHAVSMLRDRVFSLIDRRGEELFRDPWAAALDYGEVVVHPPSPQRAEELIDRHGAPGLDPAARRRAVELLELVRQTLFSATSCGWFYDDIAGLESVQVLRHAARAAELMRDVFEIDPDPDLQHALADAHSNLPGAGDGAQVHRSRALTGRRKPREAATAHTILHLRGVLDGGEPPSSVSNAFGAYATEDVAPPKAIVEPNGPAEAETQLQVTQLRTGVTVTHTVRLYCESPGRPFIVQVDGEPVTDPCPTIREFLLELAAGRASSLLPAPNEEVLLRCAWIGREARELGAPLPSPFPEALRGGGRALVELLLARPPRSPHRAIRALTEVLSAVHAAGLTHEELADLRSGLDHRLADYAEWALATGGPDAVADLATAVEVTRMAVGDDVLLRIRRFLVDQAKDAPRELLTSLLAASGVAPDALVPIEDVPPPAKEDARDALV